MSFSAANRANAWSTSKPHSRWRAIPAALIAVILTALMLPVSVAYLNAQTLRSDPGADALYREASQAFRNNDYATAERLLQRIHMAFPEDERAAVGLAEAVMANNRPAEARSMLERLLPRSADAIYIQVRLANFAVRTGDSARAIEILLPLAAEHPNRADVQDQLGEVYLAANKPLDALPYWERASRLDVTNPWPLFRVAFAYEQSGQTDKAKAAYEELLRLEPDHPSALNNLAWMLSNTGGDLEDALTYATKARALQPDDASIDTLGWVYLKQGRAKEAVEEFGQAILKSSKTNPEFRKHLAEALNQISTRNGALTPDQAELQSLLAADESPASNNNIESKENDERLRAVLRRMK
jgi:predicted Zn-dependent protease